jgi:hypothetical protein
MVDYTDYYVNQAGNGLPGFSGPRFQKGYGFFSMLKRWGVPLLKYIGKSALQTGVNIGSDILDGKQVRESAKKQLVSTGRSMASDAVARARKYVQTGTGKKRRKQKYSKKKRTKKGAIGKKGKGKKGRVGKRKRKAGKKSVKHRKQKRKVQFNDIFSS